MSSEKTTAIVLRLIPFSESSYVVTLYSEDFGKITGMAKGARRAKSAFASALDLLSVCRIVFIRKSSDAMDLLTEAALEQPFRAARRDLSRLYGGYYVLELIDALTDQRDPNPSLFRTLQETVKALDSNANVNSVLVRFELNALKLLGQLPSLYDCVECGDRVNSNTRVAFGQTSGGVLCERCKIGKRHVVSLSLEAIEAIRQLSNERSAAGFHFSNPNVQGELRGLMNHYMSHLLGRRPRMFSFMGFP
ncbi:MAG: DNA repair protein RecO [Planctomycetales bacterium]|nr:DNA repair protein RecO [Planctomycetales bacterium]